jgi:hypothetical protein
MISIPVSPKELKRLLLKLAPKFSADHSLPVKVVRTAIQEVISCIEESLVNGDTPSGCQSLVGLMLIAAAESELQEPTLKMKPVTIKEARSKRTVV